MRIEAISLPYIAVTAMSSMQRQRLIIDTRLCEISTVNEEYVRFMFGRDADKEHPHGPK